MYCSKCGKEITNTANFCPSCGAASNNSAEPHSRPQSQNISLNLASLRPLLTGLGAISIIVLMLIPMMSVPIVSAILGVLGLGDGWFSFYDMVSLFYGFLGVEDQAVFPFIITGLYFLFSVNCMLALATYLYRLGKKRTNARQTGKAAFSLTIAFSILVLGSVLLLNLVVSNQLGEFGREVGVLLDLRAIELRWTFYVMAAIAIAGRVFGFDGEGISETAEEKEKTRKSTRYLCLLAVFVVAQILAGIFEPGLHQHFYFMYIFDLMDRSVIILIAYLLFEYGLKVFIFAGLFIYLLKTDKILKTVVFFALGLFVNDLARSILLYVRVEGAAMFSPLHLLSFNYLIFFFATIAAYGAIGVIGKVKMPAITSFMVIGILFAITPLLVNFARGHGLGFFPIGNLIAIMCGAAASLVTYLLKEKLKI